MCNLNFSHIFIKNHPFIYIEKREIKYIILKHFLYTFLYTLFLRLEFS